jgi:hypothetical protein
MFVKPRHFLRDGCICYTEGCPVVYSLTESYFLRRAAAYSCLRVINTCELQFVTPVLNDLLFIVIKPKAIFPPPL